MIQALHATHCSVIFIACFLIQVELSESARILAIIPIPSYSHQIPFRLLWKTLSQRGHEVVVITADPMNDPTLKNLTEISVKHNYEEYKGMNHIETKMNSGSVLVTTSEQIWPIFHKFTRSIYENPEVKKMYAPDSGVEFDVVMVETLLNHGCYALAHRFNAPFIGLSSIGLYVPHHYFSGAPILPSHVSTWEMEENTGVDLTFWKRITNYIDLWRFMYRFLHDFLPKQQEIAEQYLGKDIPWIGDIEKNMSMHFINQQEALSHIRPTLPNILRFGGFHVSPNVEPLPKDIQSFVDDSSNGFIYVSLGTNVKSSLLPSNIKEMFFEVFSKLPCKVLWKYDGDPPKKYDNIHIQKWFPQQSVLAHPKIRLFFYQGGLQSTEEAVHFAVPLIGMPIIGDQHYQVSKMVDLGVARYIDIRTMTKELLEESFADVLNNKRYKEKMLQVREIVQQKPHNTLDTVVWWTEFIMKNRGAPHLRCSIADEPWYQRYDIDVIAFLSIVAFTLIVSLFFILYQILLCLSTKSYGPTREQKMAKKKHR